MAGRPGTTREWSARWKCWPTSRSVRRPDSPSDTRLFRLRRKAFEQIRQIVGMLLFHREDSFEYPARRRIVTVEVLDRVAVAVDRDALCHQVLLDHVDQHGSRDIFGVAAADQASR